MDNCYYYLSQLADDLFFVIYNACTKLFESIEIRTGGDQKVFEAHVNVITKAVSSGEWVTISQFCDSSVLNLVSCSLRSVVNCVNVIVPRINFSNWPQQAFTQFLTVTVDLDVPTSSNDVNAVVAGDFIEFRRCITLRSVQKNVRLRKTH